MPKISERKRDKITEQILYFLYTVSPESRFTSAIAESIVRDEEFTLSLLKNLKDKKLIVPINKNKEGKDYLKRIRWRLADNVFEAYSKAQEQQNKKNQLQNNNIYNIQDKEE